MDKKKFTCLIFLLVTTSFLVAQPGQDKIAAVRNVAPAIDSLFKKYAQQVNAPGMAYGVVYGGQLVAAGGYGYSNIDKKYNATEGSCFHIASMTKSFVSMAILQLRDKGKIRLDDPAYRYIPELRNQKYLSGDAAAFTIRNLLTHSAGFPEDNPWGDRQLAISDSDMLAMFKKGISFSNDPGRAYEYSNMGFAMLGYIIKKVSGLSYERYITQNILLPLGMTHTYFEYAKVPEKDLAIGYRYVNGAWVEQPMLHDGAYGAMGGMITTIGDFQKYVAFHLSAYDSFNQKALGALKKSSVLEMQKPWQFNTLNAAAIDVAGRPCPTVAEYGYGLRWTKDCNGLVLVGHSGGLPGFGSNWMIAPDYGIGIISFMNITYAPGTMINTHVLDTLITLAHLSQTALPVSEILKQRKKELIHLLPDWKAQDTGNIFAENFFKDYFIDSLRKESKQLFDEAGKILSVQKIVPENNLRGEFILNGERSAISVWFSLSPENPAKIQALSLKPVPSKK